MNTQTNAEMQDKINQAIGFAGELSGPNESGVHTLTLTGGSAETVRRACKFLRNECYAVVTDFEDDPSLGLWVAFVARA